MNYKRLIPSLILPQLAGLIGSVFTVSAIPTWYAGLNKQSFSPPNWVFSPVWITLYFLMGISVYLIWQKIDENEEVKNAVLLFWIHLFFNAIWSILFFGLKNITWAFIDIVLIWFFIVTLIIRFWGIDRKAAYLLIPYLLWVSFASVLNYFLM